MEWDIPAAFACEFGEHVAVHDLVGADSYGTRGWTAMSSGRPSGQGRHDGGPLAPKTVLNVHQILRTALGDAERAGLVHRNVARLMNPPCHGVAPEQRCWNEHELRQFLHVVLGLCWSDIDLDASTLSIRRSVSCTGYQVHTTPTKTRTSRRAIDLDATTIAVLREWQRRQRAELGEVTSDGSVFTRGDGQPVHPHALSQTFERLKRAAWRRR